eukprot:SAG11_NODE_542_length_8640_cov_5.667603_11_plen_194_part_00
MPCVRHETGSGYLGVRGRALDLEPAIAPQLALLHRRAACQRARACAGRAANRARQCPVCAAAAAVRSPPVQRTEVGGRCRAWGRRGRRPLCKGLRLHRGRARTFGGFLRTRRPTHVRCGSEQAVRRRMRWNPRKFGHAHNLCARWPIRCDESPRAQLGMPAWPRLCWARRRRGATAHGAGESAGRRKAALDTS